jgi:hypothetical protein|tara:strand:- start:7184 stop:7687 length:504 start_codon:yes stop_codon:yes gene_type:complete
MSNQIVNRVANSILKTIDLEELYPQGTRVAFDIAPWLQEGIILREKNFREAVSNHPWEQYKNNFVSIHCSTDSIIPAWAFMLIATKLTPHAQKTVIGSQEVLETILFTEVLNMLDLSSYKDTPVIIKGCANKPIPPAAYGMLISKLQPIAKSIMYGEACSSVPLYKR